MQFWVYIVRCNDGSYYAGHTDDLEKRLAEHRAGRGCAWTRWRRPVELVWCDWTSSRYEALSFERQIKNWSRAKKEALIAGNWARAGYFARPPHERPSTEFILSAAAGGVEGLGMNESGGCSDALGRLCKSPTSFVPSEVEGRPAGVNEAP